MDNKPSWDTAPKDAKILVRRFSGLWQFGTFHDARLEGKSCIGLGSGQWISTGKQSAFGEEPLIEYRPERDLKYDQGKLRHDLIPPEAEKALAEVLTFGAAKYEPDSWRDVKDGKRRYMAAALRHINAHRMGEELDEESGLTHLSHALTNLAFLVALDD